MRFVALAFCLSLLLGACAKNKPAKDSDNSTQTSAPKKAQETENKKPEAREIKPVVTPDDSPAGKIVLVNRNARFVVVNFSTGIIPPSGRPLFVYRKGLKVGELRVTGPQQGDNTVADLLTGDAEVKDEVKEE